MLTDLDMSETYEPKYCDGSQVDGPLEIGRMYLVPGVDDFRASSRFGAVWHPIVGPAHTDEGLGVTELHWHPDLRFWTDRQIERAYRYASRDYALGYALGEVSCCVGQKVTWKRRRCRRHNPDFPLIQMAVWDDFHAEYDGREVNCGRCPHRGMNLNHIPAENGRVVCHGHGLLVDMDAGRVLNRFREMPKYERTMRRVRQKGRAD